MQKEDPMTDTIFDPCKFSLDQTFQTQKSYIKKLNPGILESIHIS
jgi:hypothetical protein